jgi:NADPH:quinone reductase-like Zn-dependent oxidoreductase
MAAIDVARLLRARVLAVASSPEKLQACSQRGAEAVVDYERESLKDRIRDITGGGADVVVDPVGGPHSEAALRATRYGARFVTVGYASGEIPRIPLNLVLLKGVRVMGYESLAFRSNAPGLYKRDIQELWELFGSGHITPNVCATYGLDQVAAALRHVGDRRAIGKVVLRPWQ